MFMDGTIYAAVSNNLANGFGDFWRLTFSKTFLTDYSEQLPLFFGIQGLFFKILGSSIYTERFFQFMLVGITGFNMIKIWKLTFSENKPTQQLEWFAILLWIIIPVCSWAYIHNIQETLMAVFSTASVYFVLKGLIHGRRIFLYLVLGGVCIFCCSFCKGFQGLFPIVTVGLYWLFFRKISFGKMLWLSLILLLVPVLIYSLLLANEVSFQCLLNNFNNRIVRTFTNQNSSTTDNRFYIIYRLFTELIPSLIIVFLAFIIFRLKRVSGKVKSQLRYCGFYCFIGISGSFPLIITTEQRGFYLVTTLPFFALSLATLVAPFVVPLVESVQIKSKGFTIFRFSTIILLFSVLIFSGFQFGETKRDKNMLHDIYTIGNSIPQGAIISVTPILRQDYTLVAYFSRYFHISLDINPSANNIYYLKKKDSIDEVPNSYSKVNLALEEYELYMHTIYSK